MLRREIKKVEEGIDPMFTFRDPAQNARIDLPNEREKHHNAEGMRSWIMRIHAAYSPIADDVCSLYEAHRPRPTAAGRGIAGRARPTPLIRVVRRS